MNSERTTAMNAMKKHLANHRNSMIPRNSNHVHCATKSLVATRACHPPKSTPMSNHDLPLPDQRHHERVLQVDGAGQVLWEAAGGRWIFHHLIGRRRSARRGGPANPLACGSQLAHSPCSDLSFTGFKPTIHRVLKWLPRLRRVIVNNKAHSLPPPRGRWTDRSRRHSSPTTHKTWIESAHHTTRTPRRAPLPLIVVGNRAQPWTKAQQRATPFWYLQVGVGPQWASDQLKGWCTWTCLQPKSHEFNPIAMTSNPRAMASNLIATDSNALDSVGRALEESHVG